MRFTVQLVTRVPLFADVEIEADSPEAAVAAFEAQLAGASHDSPLACLPWVHGEAVSVRFPGALDGRDVDSIEVQGVVPSHAQDTA